MAAAELDIYIEQGSRFFRTYKFSIGGVAVDLTGFTFRGQIRSTQNSATIIASFVFTILNQGTNPGEVTCSLSDTVTAAIAVPTSTTACRKSAKYIYDMEYVDTLGDVKRFFQGIAEVSPEVTR